MTNFNFFFGLKLGCLIFTDTEKLSRVLQSSSCCLEDVFCAAETVIVHFQRIRGTKTYRCEHIYFSNFGFLDDNSFKFFYASVLKDSEGLTEKPILPRRRHPPRRYASSSTPVDFTTCEQFYEKQYIEVLDIIIDMLQIRFTQKCFKLLCDVEKFIIDLSNNPLDDVNERIQLIMDFCKDDINVRKLQAEAYMISDFFKSVINTKQLKIKQITKISTICEILNLVDIGKQMFQEYHKLIKLYLTIPVSTATAERTFSALNRLKNALRASMGQPRLNHCLLAHIYKEKLDEIDPNQIMSTFISSNERRQTFFGLI